MQKIGCLAFKEVQGVSGHISSALEQSLGVCFGLNHSYSEWLRIQVSLELTQDGLHSVIKMQPVSRELFDVYWGPQRCDIGPSLRRLASA